MSIRGRWIRCFSISSSTLPMRCPEGEISIFKRKIVFFSETDEKPVGVTIGRYVRISVTDNGVGMDSKTLERIFEPFFTTKQKGTGTGLGLASAYGIIKNHGGSIHVFSEPGKGTTFHIYLPATDHQPVVNEEKKDEVFTGGETILIVDDEPINISVMQEMLEMLHYRVLLAGSGQEAVAVYMVKQKEINIVILDMVMPGIRREDIRPPAGDQSECRRDPCQRLQRRRRGEKNYRPRMLGLRPEAVQAAEFSKKIREVLDNRGRSARPETRHSMRSKRVARQTIKTKGGAEAKAIRFTPV